MTDAEWIKAVREYALQFGYYRFGRAEMERMRPYVKHIPLYPGVMHWDVSLTLAYDLLDEMERGMVIAITEKLTQ